MFSAVFYHSLTSIERANDQSGRIRLGHDSKEIQTLSGLKLKKKISCLSLCLFFFLNFSRQSHLEDSVNGLGCASLLPSQSSNY